MLQPLSVRATSKMQFSARILTLQDVSCAKERVHSTCNCIAADISHDFNSQCKRFKFVIEKGQTSVKEILHNELFQSSLTANKTPFHCYKIEKNSLQKSLKDSDIL